MFIQMINDLRVIHAHFEVPPPDAPPGRCPVRAELYNEANRQRLPVLDTAEKTIDDQVPLGYQDLP